MRKALAVALAAALLVWLLASPASARTTTKASTGKLGPEVAATLASLPPGDMTTVVVTLRERADLAAVPGTNRAARLRNMIQALKTRASASQVQIRTLLRARDTQGKVAGTTPLWIFNGISVTATAEVIEELATRADVASVTRDDVTVVPAAGIPAPNLAAVEAPALWDLGYTGQGVVVASLDSGVDVSHADLESRWRGGANSWYDPYGEHTTTPTDLSGHGTATMGVIVGGDAGGTSIGMAPGSTWIAAKIFDDNGGATATAVHQAFQWVLDPDHDPNTNDAPQVVNGSWSIGAGPGCDLSFQPDLQALRTAGIVPVFAAGNYGPGGSTSVSPANYPEAMAVGAVSNQDLIYSASSRGPSTCGGRTSVFPDLVTPGVDIRTTDRNGLYQTATGTSLSAPHASGALALLLGAIPGLSPDRQLTALTETAHDLGPSGPDTGYGYGRLDVLAAYDWLQAQPDFGVALAPTAASVAPGEGVTYTVQVTPVNGFGADVSLSLSGLPAAQPGWSFTPEVVPGGTGTSQLSIVTSTAIPPGSYPLTVTASSGTISRTASATLTVTAPPGFTVAAAPAVATVNAGASTTFTVSVGSANGFAGTVALSAAGLPTGVGTATFTPASMVGPGTAQLSLVTVTSAPGGAYAITVTATSGTTMHTATVSLTVRARDFALSVTRASASVARGGAVSYPIGVAAVGRFTGRVTLARSGVPTRATTSWSKNPVIVPGSSTLRVKTSTSTPRGTYTLVITGTSVSITHRVSVTLTVT
jgi:subtilisin family serine protease